MQDYNQALIRLADKQLNRFATLLQRHTRMANDYIKRNYDFDADTVFDLLEDSETKLALAYANVRDANAYNANVVVNSNLLREINQNIKAIELELNY